MLHAQMSREQRLENADDIVSNEGSIEELEDRLLALHHRYLEMAESNKG
jgi:dephospho-CoA kinase